MPRYARRSSAARRVSVDANAGIAVPVTPTDIFRNIIAGATAPIVAALPIAGGFGVSVASGGSVAHVRAAP